MLARKGQRLTVEALNLVPVSEHVVLEVIGGGPVETEFRDWLAQTDLAHPVTLRGTISWNEVLRAYDGADVFIFTSLRDTDGIQLLEAMAHSLPIITLDHQGAADLVPDGAGIKVPVTSPAATRQAIATAIRRMASSADLRAAMGAVGHQRALTFTLSRRIQDIEGLYASVVSGTATRDGSSATAKPT
jgi:glycosyltransferase involved in cell wall biosynthesis